MDAVYGTYLHGPLLPKNPALADHLLALAARRAACRRSRRWRTPWSAARTTPPSHAS